MLSFEDSVKRRREELQLDGQQLLSANRNGLRECRGTRGFRHEWIRAKVRARGPAGECRQYNHALAHEKARTFLRSRHAVTDGNGRMFVAHDGARAGVAF